MKVLRLNYLTGIVLLWLAMVIPALAAEWSFDKMIGEVESKLPLLEKQAQVIVKMLNSEKHRQQIEADLAKSCGKDLLGSNTYLYRVLKKLGMPLEDTVINAERIFKGYPTYYYGGLEWFLLVDLSTGGTRYYSNPIYKEAGFLDESKAQQLVNVANRLMKIQKTVMVAKQKLSKNDCVVKKASFSYKKAPSLLSKKDGTVVYDFLFNATRRTVYNKGEFFKNLKPVGGRYPSKLEKYPTIYLEYLMSLASYLEEAGIGEKDDVEVIDWDQVRKNLKGILAQKAETLEIDDLL